MNQFILGDCFIELNKLIDNGIKFDAIICDPPYNIDYANEDWDNNFNLPLALELCSKLIKENGNIVIFQGWSNVCQTKQLMDKYWKIQNWIIWDRIKGRGATKNVTSTREDILWYSNGDNPTFNKMYSNIKKVTSGLRQNGHDTRALSNVWYDISPIVPWGKERNGHPTQKPMELMNRIIQMFTKQNDLILDFCAGSGTTGLSAKALNRQSVCIEKEEKYYNIQKERYFELFGEQL